MIVCSIYGHLLRSRDKNVCAEIAKMILEIFYADGKAPYDILVRQWTMLIFQYADYLNGGNAFWGEIEVPFIAESPLFVNEHHNWRAKKPILAPLIVLKDCIIHCAVFPILIDMSSGLILLVRVVYSSR